MLNTAAKTEAPGAEQELTDGFHLVIDALQAERADHDLWRARNSDHRSRPHGAGRRHSRAVVPPRAERGLCGGDRGFLTKKPGVCLTVSAPGFLNGLTALAHAQPPTASR